MATLIRSPRIGEPKRIAFSGKSAEARMPAEENVGATPTVESASLPAGDGAPVDAEATCDPRTARMNLEGELEQTRTQLQHALARAISAEQRLQAVESDLEILREEARQQGRRQGKQEGQEQGRSALEADAVSLMALTASIERQSRELLFQQEERLVEVVHAAVVRILGEALANETGVRHAVAQVLQLVSQRDAMVIRVSPHEHSLLVKAAGELLKDTQATGLEIIPDERVELGGCILETTAGSLDGRLEVQLANLRQALLSAWERRRSADR